MTGPAFPTEVKNLGAVGNGRVRPSDDPVDRLLGLKTLTRPDV